MKKRACYTVLGILACMLIIVPSQAATQRCRLGEILSAQMSKRMVSIANLNKFALPNIHYDSKLYAIVVLRLDKGRSLSIHDFSLKQGSDNFPCVAIAKNSYNFDGKVWKLENANGKDLYAMLFIVNVIGYDSSSELIYNLTYNLSRSGIVKNRLTFKNLYYSSFTSISSIPTSGLLQANNE